MSRLPFEELQNAWAEEGMASGRESLCYVRTETLRTIAWLYLRSQLCFLIWQNVRQRCPLLQPPWTPTASPQGKLRQGAHISHSFIRLFLPVILSQHWEWGTSPHHHRSSDLGQKPHEIHRCSMSATKVIRALQHCSIAWHMSQDENPRSETEGDRHRTQTQPAKDFKKKKTRRDY